MAGEKKWQDFLTKKNSIRKRDMVCRDGPWAGVTLRVSTAETMWMNIGGRRGRYVNGYWEKQDANSGEPDRTPGATGDR